MVTRSKPKMCKEPRLINMPLTFPPKKLTFTLHNKYLDYTSDIIHLYLITIIHLYY